jgi:hypothetical protein
MCDNNEWRTQEFNNKRTLYGSIAYNGSGDVRINGRVNNALGMMDAKVVFWAPAPPNYRTSYSGSALPFTNSEMAFDKTPNAGTVNVNRDGTFSFSLQFPNAYYAGLGTLFVSPHVRLQTIVNGKVNDTEVVRVGEGIPFRLLTYPPVPATAPRCSPSFYARDHLPLRTQEQILRDSAYPAKNVMPTNFWGLRPPQ